MTTGLAILWLLVGWCGTVPVRFPPRPEPDPWWIRFAGAVGGVAGGLAFSAVWPADGMNAAAYAALTSVGAVIGGVIASDLGSRFRPGTTGRQLAR